MVRAWIAELRALPHYRIEMRELRHRVLGANQVPAAVWVDTLDDALAILGKRRDAERFAALVETVRDRQLGLLDWLARRPLKALELTAAWERLLDVVEWLQHHPRLDVYLRQVDIPGVHSKFIEAHRGVLSEWLDRVLPAEAIDPAATGASGFAIRYGFRGRPQRIRLRALDPNRALIPGLGDADLAVDADTFIRRGPPISRVFVTGNEINFLAFPKVANSLLIFGAGYGSKVLARVGAPGATPPEALRRLPKYEADNLSKRRRLSCGYPRCSSSLCRCPTEGPYRSFGISTLWKRKTHALLLSKAIGMSPCPRQHSIQSTNSSCRRRSAASWGSARAIGWSWN